MQTHFQTQIEILSWHMRVCQIWCYGLEAKATIGMRQNRSDLKGLSLEIITVVSNFSNIALAKMEVSAGARAGASWVCLIYPNACDNSLKRMYVTILCAYRMYVTILCVFVCNVTCKHHLTDVTVCRQSLSMRLFRHVSIPILQATSTPISNILHFDCNKHVHFDTHARCCIFYSFDASLRSRSL